MLNYTIFLGGGGGFPEIYNILQHNVATCICTVERISAPPLQCRTDICRDNSGEIAFSLDTISPELSLQIHICTALQWGCRYPLNPYSEEILRDRTWQQEDLHPKGRTPCLDPTPSPTPCPDPTPSPFNLPGVHKLRLALFD